MGYTFLVVSNALSPVMAYDQYRSSTGHLLFSLHINNLWDVVNDEHIGHVLYAAGVKRMARIARQVSESAARNEICLNASNTETILFGMNRNVNEVSKPGLLEIDMGNRNRIPFSDTVESLGVILDSKLA